MWEALEALPPKVLALSSNEPSKPIELPADESLETRVDDVTARIQQATFTGKGDRAVVQRLLQDFHDVLDEGLAQWRRACAGQEVEDIAAIVLEMAGACWVLPSSTDGSATST